MHGIMDACTQEAKERWQWQAGVPWWEESGHGLFILSFYGVGGVASMAQ
jgi:hypothetical protein